MPKGVAITDAAAAPAKPARRKMGRPTNPRWQSADGAFDRTAYSRQYQRQRRAAAKAAKAAELDHASRSSSALASFSTGASRPSVNQL
jgi:hypothetical protein